MPNIGDRFGSIVLVKRLSPVGATQIFWEYKCDCGKTGDVSHFRLRQNDKQGRNIKSCGCKNFRGIHGNCRNKTSAESSMKGWISKYWNSASGRKLKWAISDKYAYKLFLSACYFCGSPPNTKYNRYVSGGKFICRRETQWTRNAWIIVNGIDRLDNTLGYVKGNVVPCCKICNYAKSDRSLPEWNAWLDQLIKFRSGR